MSGLCRCGGDVSGPDAWLVCVRCGVACCLGCAFSIHGDRHCRRCGEAALEWRGRLGLDTLEASACFDETAAARCPWVIVVARDQPGLYAHLLQAFARDQQVEILLDRRRGAERNSPEMAERLRTYGAALVRRPR